MILEETTQTITKDNKENKNIYYDNDDNITQQHCDQINLLGRSKGDKYYEHRLDARIDISDCWCVA